MSRWTWSSSPLNSARSTPKSWHTFLITDSQSSRISSVNTPWRCFVTNTKCAWQSHTACLPRLISLLSLMTPSVPPRYNRVHAEAIPVPHVPHRRASPRRHSGVRLCPRRLQRLPRSPPRPPTGGQAPRGPVLGDGEGRDDQGQAHPRASVAVRGVEHAPPAVRARRR